MFAWIPVVSIAMSNGIEEVMGVKHHAAIMFAADFVHSLHIFMHIPGNGADVCLAKGIYTTASVETVLAVHVRQIVVHASQRGIA